MDVNIVLTRADVEKTIRKFEAKFVRGSWDDCWLWTGNVAVPPSGPYGLLHIAVRPTIYRKVLAHRLSYGLAKGLFPSHLWVLHHCDNPRCVNPAHLFLGTHDDNMKDMATKHRSSKLPGEKNGRARLTADDVRAIRASPLGSRDLGLQYGIGPDYVWGIRARRTWKHLL